MVRGEIEAVALQICRWSCSVKDEGARGFGFTERAFTIVL